MSRLLKAGVVALLLCTTSITFAQKPTKQGNVSWYIMGPDGKVQSGSSALNALRSVSPEQYMLGISLKEVPDGLHALIGIEPGTGVLVAGVTPDGPAQQAGLQKHDLILQVDGESLKSPEQLQKLVKATEDKSLSLSIRRGQEAMDVEVTPIQAKNLKWNGKPPWEAMDLQLPEGFELNIPENMQHGFEFLGPGIMQMQVPNRKQIEDLESQVRDLAKQLESVQEQLKKLEQRINP